MTMLLFSIIKLKLCHCENIHCSVLVLCQCAIHVLMRSYQLEANCVRKVDAIRNCIQLAHTIILLIITIYCSKCVSSDCDKKSSVEFLVCTNAIMRG